MRRGRYREAWWLCRLAQPTRPRQLLAFAAVVAATGFEPVPVGAMALAADAQGVADAQRVALIPLPQAYLDPGILGEVRGLLAHTDRSDAGADVTMIAAGHP